MAKTDNLIDFLGDIADGIREKKGTTDPINAQDFRSEIDSIETETDGMRYFDVRGFSDDYGRSIASSCSLVKSYIEGGGHIITPGMHGSMTYNWTNSNVGAIAVDNRDMVIEMQTMSVPQMTVTMGGIDVTTTFPEITKEEFYDLTWDAPEQSGQLD